MKEVITGSQSNRSRPRKPSNTREIGGATENKKLLILVIII